MALAQAQVLVTDASHMMGTFSGTSLLCPDWTLPPNLVTATSRIPSNRGKTATPTLGFAS